MSKNAEKFLDDFNKIEKNLKSTFNNGYYILFVDLIRKEAANEEDIKR